MSHKRAKVLMVGPVSGRLRLLSEKLCTLQRSRAGPFDVCLCAGPFFHQMTAAAQAAGKEGTADESGGGETKAGDDGEDPRKKELEELREAATKDGKDLADGSLTFDIPVLFVDAGDGIPEGIEVKNPMVDALKKDDDEIDLDDEEDEPTVGDGDAKESEGDSDAAKTPDGLLRIARNLYQLVGDARQQSRALESVADIVSVPLPLIDPQPATNDETTKKREHATSLTIGFLGPKIRLPCGAFSEKSRHASFLGCDVLISGEWGQGMSSAACGALTADDRTAMGFGGEGVEEVGSYDVAELVAFSRPRYHVAPGSAVPVQLGEDKAELRRRFVASLPYRYPAASTASEEGGSHAGRFLAMGSVMPASESKSLGKAFKFIHAVGIVPLSHMDANDRETAREANSVVDCPSRLR